MTKKAAILKKVNSYIYYLVGVWFLYRLIFRQVPTEAEEIFIKPLIWLTPIIYLISGTKNSWESLGFTKKNIFPALYFVLALGAGFALEGLLVNIFKYSVPQFSANIGQTSFAASMVVSFITAFTEETVFRGFVFNRLNIALGNEVRAVLLSSSYWTLIHLPVGLMLGGSSLAAGIGYLVLVFIFGLGSAFVFARTQNVLASILLHVFWEWPILLFR